MPAKSIIYCDKPPKLKCFSINKTDEILMIGLIDIQYAGTFCSYYKTLHPDCVSYWRGANC